MGKFLGAQLCYTLSSLDYVGDVRGRGLFWAVEFVADEENRVPFSQGQVMAPRVVESAFENGLSIQSGISGADAERVDCVIISPPYNVSRGEILQIVSILRLAIVEVAKKIPSED